MSTICSKLLKLSRYRNFSTSKLQKIIRNDNAALTVFDRKTKLLQRKRAGLASDVDVYDYLKDEVGYRLADRVFDIKRQFKLAADVGCGRGYVSKHITPDSIEELILCDTCQSNLDSIVVQDGVKVRKQILDEENIEFPPNSLDLIISSLNLHWVNNLPGAFQNIINGLKQDGVFMASVFGGGTLYELRGSLQLAENERRGGIAPHISPFTEVQDIGSLMTRAGFTMLTIDTDEIVINYPTIFELMLDLKGMAESNASINRTIHLHRDTQFAAAAIYHEMYGKRDEESGRDFIPATFQIINMLGWKPHPSQPKPIERGSAEFSLKDLDKLDKAIKDSKVLK